MLLAGAPPSARDVTGPGIEAMTAAVGGVPMAESAVREQLRLLANCLRPGLLACAAVPLNIMAGRMTSVVVGLR